MPSGLVKVYQFQTGSLMCSGIHILPPQADAKTGKQNVERAAIQCDDFQMF
jgi:hypothetical protein